MRKSIIILSSLFLTITMQAQDRPQPKPGPAPSINIKKPVSFTLPNGLKAVSYTHLDVYKRQLYDCVHNKLFS